LLCSLRDAESCPTRKLSDTEVVRHGSSPTWKLSDTAVLRHGSCPIKSVSSPCKSPTGSCPTRKVIDRKLSDTDYPVCCGLTTLTKPRGRKLYLFRFTLRPPAKRLWCQYVLPQPQPPFINHPYSFKSDISNKSGVLRPPAVQSVQGCYARLHTPPVAAPVQKPPLTFKIRHFKKYWCFTSSGRRT